MYFLSKQDMRSILIIVFLSISPFLYGQATKSHFKITSDKKEVGYLIATMDVQDDVVVYEISSEVSIRILFRVKMENKIRSVFKNGILISSTAVLYLNGNVYSDTKIEKAEGYYRVVKDGDHSKIIADEIRSCSAKLYFKEPIGEAVSLSETEGELKDVDLQGFGKYALNSDGSEKSVSTYNYGRNEVLNQIEVIRPYVPELFIYRVDDLSDLDSY
jgi:hypothetical protein